MNRGDVVVVDFAAYNPADKARPALVIQNNRDNARINKTIVAVITGNLRRASEDTHYLIDSSHPDFSPSGLHGDSVVNCSNLYTIEQRDVSRIIGSLSQVTMQAINECLKAALSIT